VRGRGVRHRLKSIASIDIVEISARSLSRACSRRLHGDSWDSCHREGKVELQGPLLHPKGRARAGRGGETHIDSVHTPSTLALFDAAAVPQHPSSLNSSPVYLNPWLSLSSLWICWFREPTTATEIRNVGFWGFFPIFVESPFTPINSCRDLEEKGLRIGGYRTGNERRFILKTSYTWGGMPEQRRR